MKDEWLEDHSSIILHPSSFILAPTREALSQHSSRALLFLQHRVHPRVEALVRGHRLAIDLRELRQVFLRHDQVHAEEKCGVAVERAQAVADEDEERLSSIGGHERDDRAHPIERRLGELRGMDDDEPRELLIEKLARARRIRLQHRQKSDELHGLAQRRIVRADDERLFAELVLVVFVMLRSLRRGRRALQLASVDDDLLFAHGTRKLHFARRQLGLVERERLVAVRAGDLDHRYSSIDNIDSPSDSAGRASGSSVMRNARLVGFVAYAMAVSFETTRCCHSFSISSSNVCMPSTQPSCMASMSERPSDSPFST